MIEYLLYVSYALSVNSTPYYQPLIEYFAKVNQKYQQFVQLNNTEIIDHVKFFHSVITILFFLSFFGRWLATLGCLIMLPYHLTATMVSFQQTCSENDQEKRENSGNLENNENLSENISEKVNNMSNKLPNMTIFFTQSMYSMLNLYFITSAFF